MHYHATLSSYKEVRVCSPPPNFPMKFIFWDIYSDIFTSLGTNLSNKEQK